MLRSIVLILLLAPSAFAFQMRVLSYNIHGLPVPIGVDHSRYKDIVWELQKRSRLGTAPDLVLLQEAFHHKTDLFQTSLNYPWVFSGPGSKKIRRRSGLFILSQFQATQSQELIFTTCVSWDCAVRKGIQAVELMIPQLQESLYLLNTHMNADPSGDPIVSSEKTTWIRKHQIFQLVPFINQLIATGKTIIFGGDFNFKGVQPDFDLFLRIFPFFHDALNLCLANSLQCQPQSDVMEEKRESVDHFFIHSGETSKYKIVPQVFEKSFTQKVNGRYLSDHEGLEYVLEFIPN